MTGPLPLHVRRVGTPGAFPTLVLVHGLFGSGRNLMGLARSLGRDRLVLLPDLRNHGESPWEDDTSYAALAGDLAALIEAAGGPVDVAGHSMGGKAAMVLALTRPELVRKLAVLDIAPVAYGHSQRAQIDAMRRVDLSTVGSRAEAVAQMAHADRGVAEFLALSLDLPGRRWELNLDALDAGMAGIVRFPEIAATFEGETLFLAGDQSSYVLPEHRAAMRRLFPVSRVARIKGAGHWLHAERPAEVAEALRVFLD